MRFISEEESAALVDHAMAFDAAREALIAAVAAGTTLFPAVLGHGSEPANRFSIKSGSTAEYAGLKVGSFWPGNPDRGLPRHNSVILLFDQAVGRVDTVIEAGRVNAYRTAAADAVAASVLARPDSKVLAVFGAGNQAEFEAAALARVLPIRTVLVVARDPAKVAGFAERLAGQGASGLDVRAASAREACEAADVIVTATPARAPLFEAAWVRPGTHVAAMGADAKGKQELPPALLDRAALFCDLPEQSRTIGEFQHASARARAGLTALGGVLRRGEGGRTDPAEITVFDSSGIALQDLTIARAILAKADARL
ncbi:ornithine cyclodeaminase [Methylobacterium sp. UNC378MF]|uniref:ornithine cyclodeaminase family protein n=1 Tax=Methylobacterium sp. UNC378MF TaxID=1502748 RepID=UPI00088DCB34|nr:ornithine cyclodeaminase family protein [Methylobacterium sp. UNC378MF]SDA31968.1 ornithine cyclodeaminase [Methylobacterium sp. UNC378MF]